MMEIGGYIKEELENSSSILKTMIIELSKSKKGGKQKMKEEDTICKGCGKRFRDGSTIAIISGETACNSCFLPFSKSKNKR